MNRVRAAFPQLCPGFALYRGSSSKAHSAAKWADVSTDFGSGRYRQGEEGFLLIGLVVAVFLIALFLTVAAPTVARSLERDREVESEHRAQQYVRAIHNYYLKFNSYPTSVEQLLNQNNQHFLRQEYKDPLTGGDYRLIHSGEAKTTVKGFFGEPLDGFAQGSLGALAGNASGIGTGIGGAGTTPGAGGISAGSSPTSGGFGTGGVGGGLNFAPSAGSPAGGSAPGAGGPAGGSDGSSGSGSNGSSSTSGSTNATQFQGSKGQIVGVGSNAAGHGLVEWNGSENIQDWEFLYDHRTWLIKQRVSIFGGSIGQSGGGSLGTAGGVGIGGAGAAPGASSPFSPTGSSAPGTGSSGSPTPGSSTASPQNP